MNRTALRLLALLVFAGISLTVYYRLINPLEWLVIGAVLLLLVGKLSLDLRNRR